MASVTTPQRIAQIYKEGPCDLLYQHVMGVGRLKENAILYLNKKLSDTELTEISEHLECEENITLTPKALGVIFLLYPQERGQIIDAGFDTVARSAAYSAIADFFLGCEWPMNGSNIDRDAFIDALRYAIGQRGMQ